MISKISIVGMGAIGCAYMSQMIQTVPIGSVRVIAEGERAKRYKENGFKINGQLLHFPVFTPDEEVTPADLLLIGTKFNQLNEALDEAGKHVGPHTVILSLINGITSEEIIGARFGMDKVLYSVNAGIDAQRVGNQTVSHQLGVTYFGEKKNTPGAYSQNVQTVRAFFDQAGIQYEIPADMIRQLWWKFMLNVGANQVSAVFRASFGTFQQVKELRGFMADAMREVAAVSQKAGIFLGEEDVQKCLSVLMAVSPEGRTSMCQDILARRQTEVAIFGGTVVELGAKFGVSTPVNAMLVRIIRTQEAIFRMEQAAEKQAL